MVFHQVLLVRTGRKKDRGMELIWHGMVTLGMASEQLRRSHRGRERTRDPEEQRIGGSKIHATKQPTIENVMAVARLAQRC